MKKLSLLVLVVMMALVPSMTKAQSAIDGLYEKYAGKAGFTSINISPEMFNMMSGFTMNDSSQDAQAAMNAIKQIKSLKMLVYKPVDSTKVEGFYAIIKKNVPTSGFKDLMTIDSHGSNLKFLAHQDANGKIRELLMIVRGNHEAMVMSLTGLIDMKTIGEISKSMNIQGMGDLQKLDKKMNGHHEDK
jgi:hypothetical protein